MEKEEAVLSELEPIRNQIIFEFIEEARHGQFNSETSGGILIRETSDKQVDYCRWGRVLATGPNVTEFEEGQLVLIDKLRWTSGFKVTDKTYWVTTDEEILAVWDDPNTLPS